MVSTTRILTTDSARAKSFERFKTWLPLTPAAGSSSYLVITGPGIAANTLTSIPKSISFRSIKRDVNSKVSADWTSISPLGSSNRCNGGKGESGWVSNNGAWLSFLTRSLLGISNAGTSIWIGGRSSIRLRSFSTNSVLCCSAIRPASRSFLSRYLATSNWKRPIIAPPSFSTINIQDHPVKRLKPAAKTNSKIKVEPTKLKLACNPLSKNVPNTLPQWWIVKGLHCSKGKTAGKSTKCPRSSALDDNKTIPKPSTFRNSNCFLPWATTSSRK